MLCLILFTFLATVWTFNHPGFNDQNEHDERIISGYNSPRRKFYVRTKFYDRDSGNETYFVGVIVNESFVLSASHILRYRPNNSEFTIEVGDFTKENPDIESRSVKYTIHENYNPITFENDIMLIKLSEPVDTDYVLPMCNQSYENYTICLAGMGLVNQNTKESPKVLQEAKFGESTNNSCPANLEPLKGWTNMSFVDRICLLANDGGNQSACMGDSGSATYPMNEKNEPICAYGVVSWGFVNCTVFSVHTRLSYFESWVNDKMMNFKGKWEA